MGIFDKLKRKEIITPEQRRSNTIAILKKKGISYNEYLPLIEASSEISLKNHDVICKRAIVCLLMASCASTINFESDTNRLDIIDLHKNYLNHFELSYDDLLPLEVLVIDNNYTEQDLIDTAWSYETYWDLIWALDLISDKEIIDATKTCDVDRAIAILNETCKDYHFFKGMSKLRNIEKILDMLDLYYCYHWACVEYRINPSTTSINGLNEGVVVERRKALEWLISSENDWNDISLDT
jgi:hypothetical protein